MPASTRRQAHARSRDSGNDSSAIEMPSDALHTDTVNEEVGVDEMMEDEEQDVPDDEDEGATLLSSFIPFSKAHTCKQDSNLSRFHRQASKRSLRWLHGL